MKLLVKKKREKKEKQRAGMREEMSQQNEGARNIRIAHHSNEREGQASDASRNLAELYVSPTVVVTPPAGNTRVQFIHSDPPLSRRTVTESSSQMHDLEAQPGEVPSTPRRTLLQVPRT